MNRLTIISSFIKLNTRRIALIALVFFCQTSLGLGVVLLPEKDDEVIEVLPSGFSRVTDKERRNRNTTAELNEVQAARLIRQYLKLASDTGDERYLGYAEKTLSHWDQKKIQSIDLLLAKAALLQRGHQFEEALAVIDQVLKTSPGNGEAHLTAAYIKMTQGEANKALTHCANAGLVYGAMTGFTCTATAKSLLGDIDQTYSRLKTLQQSMTFGPIENKEALLTLAEIASMQGEFDKAESHFLAALHVAPKDSFLLMRLADLYLATGKYERCVTLLNDQRHPNLMLRLAIAKKANKQTIDKQLISALQSYFDVQQLRNPQLATRDYAEYLLNIEQRYDHALAIALINWQTQREPADTDLVLRTAIQAQEPMSTGQVKRWIESTGLNDDRINTLLKKLESL